MSKETVSLFNYTVNTETGCWEWNGCLTVHGYAHNFYGPVARQMYIRRIGPVSDSLHLDHLCRNRRCVNPGHLEPVTPIENIRRGNAGLNQRLKTHCPRGHEYNEINTRVYGGRRHCRVCDRDRRRRSRSKTEAQFEVFR